MKKIVLFSILLIVGCDKSSLDNSSLLNDGTAVQDTIFIQQDTILVTLDTIIINMDTVIVNVIYDTTIINIDTVITTDAPIGNAKWVARAEETTCYFGNQDGWSTNGAATHTKVEIFHWTSCYKIASTTIYPPDSVFYGASTDNPGSFIPIMTVTDASIDSLINFHELGFGNQCDLNEDRDSCFEVEELMYEKYNSTSKNIFIKPLNANYWVFVAAGVNPFSWRCEYLD